MPRSAQRAQAMLVGAAFLALLVAERRRPLRRNPRDADRRLARNLAVAGLSALAIRLCEKPVTDALARRVERERIGLLPRLGLPRRLEAAAAFLLLDYTLYVWHVLTHRLPFLWRFHRAHHADLDMDASTALRFHFVEMLLSVPWRALQVAAIGVRAGTLAAWQTFVLVEILFHHANLRLPLPLERALSRFVVTPRLHGIHHSTRRAERDSNWSSGLTLWDALHGTLRRDPPQEEIQIGVPELRDERELTLGRVLALPFRREAAEGRRNRLRSGTRPR